MTYTIIEPNGSISIFKTVAVGLTQFGEEYHKRMPDGSTEILESRNLTSALAEAGIRKVRNIGLTSTKKELEEYYKKLNRKIKMSKETELSEAVTQQIQSSVNDLVNAVRNQINQEIEARRKARNKRKAAKRKFKKK